MPTVTLHWKSRRLAPGAIRIVKRRVTESPTIAAFEVTTVPKAEAHPLPCQRAALDGLGPTLPAAVKEWAEAADSEHQRMPASVRELADALQADLIALRRSLLAAVGRSDKDYQKLRGERAGLPDEDDDPDSSAPPKPVVAAGASAVVRGSA